MNVCLFVLGCPKNIVEGEGMAALVTKAGHVLTTDISSADAAIVHTCSFVRDAKHESWSYIHKLAGLKAAGRLKKLIVTGCMAQEEGKKLLEMTPEIDVVLGTGQLSQLAKTLLLDEPFVSCKSPGGLLEAQRGRILSSSLPSTYIRIAEGCNHTCSFCVIPSLRGAYQSRSSASIMREAQALAAAGVQELILVAQDTTVFGRDTNGELLLAGLLKRLNSIKALRWIRVMYAYPNTVNVKLLDALRDLPKVCTYLDIPLQHASDAVLRRMGRPVNVRGVVERISRSVPGISIRTAFIVGFPGETEKDFSQLRSLVKEGWFEHAGVFEYSDNEKARSHGLGPAVPARIARRRRRELIRLQNAVVKKRNKARVGQELEVLIESGRKGGFWQGRAAFQAPEVDSVVICKGAPGRAYAGQFVKVLVNAARDLDLYGDIV